MGVKVITKTLHRSPSTVSREISRNKVESGSRGQFYRYNPHKAQDLYESRRKECHRKTINDTNVLSYIEENTRLSKLALHLFGI